jgi:hypothetical protein
MKKLRLVRLSALFQSRERLREGHPLDAEEPGRVEEAEKYVEKETRHAEEEHRRDELLEVRVDEITVDVQTAAAPATGGKSFDAPAKSHAGWGFLGLILLGSLVVKACSYGSKGGMQIMNIPFLIAAIVAIGAVTLHVYTMEVWIWPKLKDEGFPATPFGDASVTKGFYRTVWHFFTVAWLGTIILMLVFTFGDVIPYVVQIVHLLIIYWLAIVVSIFIVAALSLQPGESYIKTMIKAFQWVIVLIMVGFMYWGIK